MRKVVGATISFLFVCTCTIAQVDYILRGEVLDSRHIPLPGATVLLDDTAFVSVADKNGQFAIRNIPPGTYQLSISFLGYRQYTDVIDLSENKNLEIMLRPARESLQEVVITNQRTQKMLQEESRSVEVVSDEYISLNQSGSLMTSLERLPGISSVRIGSGQSKPVIRGLGFNRVVVTENGVKHEGQQWGSDHGLEIDQRAAEQIEIIKGPASLQYGSDAIAGLIRISQYKTPAQNSLGGQLDLYGESNQQLYGSSLEMFGRKEKLFFTARITGLNYSDYKVPADTVDIYTWKVPLDNGRVRNTAGKELNIHFSAGFVGPRLKSRFYLSRVLLKSGFFANAAGLEPLDPDTDLHDARVNDVQMPFQQVVHYKITNQSLVRFNGFKLELEAGFQQNDREEQALYSPHGSMPVIFPDSLPYSSTLEKAFLKQVWSGNIRLYKTLADRWEVSLGSNNDYQLNSIDGRGFLIPEYHRFTSGFFLFTKYRLTENSWLNGGLRYDFGKVNTQEYQSWYTPYEKRANNLSRNFQSYSWSAGYSLQQEVVSLRLNVGKSFRVPLARELAANGFNAHMFRVEIGDSSLRAEEAYQLDLNLELQHSKQAVGVSPFVSYFPSYIYLNPESDFDSITYKQKYRFTQNQVFRTGGEFHLHYALSKAWKIGAIAEYVYSRQLSGNKQGFTLPFSPPARMLFNLMFTPGGGKIIHAPHISIDFMAAFKQSQIVPPEKVTDGYQMVNISAGFKMHIQNQVLKINARINNLFNTNYFNHTSYYRLIDLPEQGTNFMLSCSIPFNLIASDLDRP